MKKILFITIIFTLCAAMQYTIYCAETSINITCTRQTDTNTVTVTGNILNAVNNQKFAVMMSKSENGIYDPGEIIYFGTVEPTFDNNNSFTIELKTNYSINADSEYLIRIGGENISTVETKILGYELSYGDIDGDYIITASDAAMVFAYVLDKSRSPLTDTQLKKASVSGLNVLSAADAACILNKAQDYSYIFPVE